ncbi:hypothetical protein Nepgr_023945 [Nepenthes gracilis]|uniref:Uncharacterized protein n=1 Tax=Nepenthes gracilis TaxID=150966 RepID=A0AAD3T3K6_NEPGR|nr:hypothetical protein Nepgr_023945 [Nepenthes gracilis]
MILSGAASSAKLMEVKVAYHSVPSSLKSMPKAPGPAVGESGCSIKPNSDQVLVGYASPDVGISSMRAVSSPVCGGIALEDGVLNQQTWSPATVVTARGLASMMPSQIIVSDPSQSPCAVYFASAGYTPVEVGAPSGSMKDVTAIGDTNAVHSVLDVGAPYVADHATDSPHRPLISTGVDGDATSVEIGLIPGVDGSTPESIARITLKYSLVDAVEGLLNKDPIEFQEVDSIPLSGCPVKGSEASGVEAVMICDPGRGLELTLPCAGPYAGDPVSDDFGILSSPDHHLPVCSMASGAPVGPSSEDVVAVQSSSPCIPCPGLWLLGHGSLRVLWALRLFLVLDSWNLLPAPAVHLDDYAAVVILAADLMELVQLVVFSCLGRGLFAFCCSWDQFHDPDAPQMVLSVNWDAILLGFQMLMYGRIRLLIAVLVLCESVEPCVDAH